MGVFRAKALFSWNAFSSVCSTRRQHDIASHDFFWKLVGQGRQFMNLHIYILEREQRRCKEEISEMSTSPRRRTHLVWAGGLERHDIPLACADKLDERRSALSLSLPREKDELKVLHAALTRSRVLVP